jgi:hypothetical protein
MLDWQTNLLLLTVAAVAYVGAISVWRLFLCPLAKFPGPKWAALSLWAEFYYDVVCRGTFIWRIEDMHRKYGTSSYYSLAINEPDASGHAKVHPTCHLGTLPPSFWSSHVTSRQPTAISSVKQAHANNNNQRGSPGPCVRINPHEIHIIDPEFFDELYVHAKKLDKYKWWTNLAGADGSSFSTIPHELHRLRRGALNPFFSVRSVSRLEPLIRSKVEKLCSRLNAAAQAGEVVRLDAAFMALTMDVICDYSFALDPRYLDEADFKLEWKQTIITAFEGGALGRQFPWMLPLMKRLPIPLVTLLNPPLGFILRWQSGVEERVKPILERRDDISLSGDAEASSRTIFHTLRDSELPESQKTLERLCDEGQILTGAGSETTAQTLARLFFYLRHKPSVLVRLREELQQSIPMTSPVPSWVELQQLPYLVRPISRS